MTQTCEFIGGPIDGEIINVRDDACSFVFAVKCEQQSICCGAGFPDPILQQSLRHIYHLKRRNGCPVYIYGGVS